MLQDDESVPAKRLRVGSGDASHVVFGADVQEHSEEAAVAQIDTLLSPAGLSDEIADLTTHVEVVSGAAARCILDYVSSIGANLIVVGNRRVQGIERLLGSVAIDVLRHAPCSVYVAHTG